MLLLLVWLPGRDTAWLLLSRRCLGSAKKEGQPSLSLGIEEFSMMETTLGIGPRRKSEGWENIPGRGSKGHSMGRHGSEWTLRGIESLHCLWDGV